MKTLRTIPKFKYSFSLKDFVLSFKLLWDLPKFQNIEETFTDSIFFTNHARTGLRLLLKSLCNNRKVKVGVQAYTCKTVFQSIRNAGCDIVFLDINKDYTLDLLSLRERVNDIDLLIVTHTFGIPADLDEIRAIAGNMIIIEDCAHSMFSKYSGKLTGTIGDASVFSFGYGKYPSIGPGGMTVINNMDLVVSFRNEYQALANPSIGSEVLNILRNFLFSIFFSPYLYGIITLPVGKALDARHDFTDKTSEKMLRCHKTNCGIFNECFQKYAEHHYRQRQNGLFMRERLSGKYDLAWAEKEGNFYIFPLRHKKRDDIVDQLLRAGFESGKHFSKSIEWARDQGYEKGTCPNTERLIREIFTIPVHYSLRDKDLKKIAKIVINISQ